jgi:hypothetical protein
LFEGQYILSLIGRSYDVTPDGQRFIMVQTQEQPPAAPLTEMIVVQNWLEELKRLVPTK